MEKVRAAMLEKTGTLRLMGLNNTGGWRDFFTTKKQIRSPADLKGVKLRTIESELQVEMVKLLGGSPTPIPWTELYTSLATGVVVGPGLRRSRRSRTRRGPHPGCCPGSGP
jgi:TRAP-type C4-dicarboxylate transport system substrate-binding protein